MRPLCLPDRQVVHFSLLSTIKIKYLGGIIERTLHFEDFCYLFDINFVRDAVDHALLEPLSFTGILLVQYNTSFTAPIKDFLDCEVDFILPHHMLALNSKNILEIFRKFTDFPLQSLLCSTCFRP